MSGILAITLNIGKKYVLKRINALKILGKASKYRSYKFVEVK